jgi:hypothetical protein
MSETVSTAGPIQEQTPTWQEDALRGNLLTHMYNTAPDIRQIVPGYSPSEPWYQKGLDYASVPARMMVGGIRSSLEDIQSALHSPALTLDIPAQRGLTSATINLGLGATPFGATEGLPAFPAWHGSRHLFEAEPGRPFGRFRDKAIDTGEGAQAFGWGHYVAGKRDTAETYRTAGADYEDPYIQLDGQSVHPTDFRNSNPIASYGMYSYMDHEGDYAKAIETMRKDAEDLRTDANDPIYANSRTQFLQGAINHDRAADWLEQNYHRLQYFGTPEPHPGYMYQTWVNPDEHEMLDWFEPFSKQSEQVQQGVRSAFIHAPNNKGLDLRNLPNMTGEQIYDKLWDLYGEDHLASRALDAAGVPGVKYLDHGSRDIDVFAYRDKPAAGDRVPVDTPGAKFMVQQGNRTMKYGFTDMEAAQAWAESQRTRNSVIFHPRHLEVIDRDGQHYGLEKALENPFK